VVAIRTFLQLLQLAAEGSGSDRPRAAALAPVKPQLLSLADCSNDAWRVSVLPSTSLPVPGIGRARWALELRRCRGGGSATFELEARDAKGRLALASTLAYRPTPAAWARMSSWLPPRYCDTGSIWTVHMKTARHRR
jgi:protein ImuA